MIKGKHLLNDNFEIIDSIKEETGVDITIFYQDVRVITTIRTNDGKIEHIVRDADTMLYEGKNSGRNRIICGTPAHPQAAKGVWL